MRSIVSGPPPPELRAQTRATYPSASSCSTSPRTVVPWSPDARARVAVDTGARWDSTVRSTDSREEEWRRPVEAARGLLDGLLGIFSADSTVICRRRPTAPIEGDAHGGHPDQPLPGGGGRAAPGPAGLRLRRARRGHPRAGRADDPARGAPRLDLPRARAALPRQRTDPLRHACSGPAAHAARGQARGRLQGRVPRPRPGALADPGAPRRLSGAARRGSTEWCGQRLPPAPRHTVVTYAGPTRTRTHSPAKRRTPHQL